MKKIYKILTLAVVPLFLNSCFNLEQEPFKELSEKNSALTVQDAQYWVNGMYNTLRDNVYGKAMYSSDVQVDFLNMAQREGVSDLFINLQNWSEFVSTNATTASIWQSYFSAIQNINIALEQIPSIPIPQDNYNNDSKQIKHNLGELYLGRAYYYTYLVTHYCPAYDESSPYGLPLLTGVTINNMPQRSSVKETYNFILADIARAEERLNDVTGRAGMTSFSKDAVAALKARVLLYKGDWTAAYTTATSIITSRYALSTTENQLKDIWEIDKEDESITQLYAAYSSGVNASTIELPSTDNGRYYIAAELNWRTRRISAYTPSVIPTQTFVDLFDNADFRKNVYIKKLFVNNGQNKYDNIYLVYKYPDNAQLKSSPYASPTYMHKPKVFRIAEMYLIAAEAAYKKGDQANAKIYLDRLRTARGIGSVTYTDLWTEIQNERNRELAFEGFRMIDIKRWGLDIVRGTPQNINTIKTDPANQYYQMNVPAASAYKLTWPIDPENIRYEQGRANWQQNPGW